MQQRHETSGNQEILTHCLHILRVNAHLIYVASLLTAIMGIVIVSLIPDKYRATTTILVDPQKIPERYVASTVTSDPNAHLNTLTQQVLSSTRLQEIVDQENLYPELRNKKSREEILDYVRSKIVIELKPGSEQSMSSFSISYVDPNRALVAPVANKLAASFIDWNLKSRQQQAVGTTQFLSNELAQAKSSLEQQEAALESFRLQHAGATPDQLNANLQALSRLQSDVQSNRDTISRLDEERILITQQQPLPSREAPAPTGEYGRLTQERIRLENDLQALRRQYTDTYPDVVAAKHQLDTVNARLSNLPAPVPGSVESYDPSVRLRLNLIDKEINRHKEQLDILQKQIAGYQGKVQSVPVLETQLAELTRNYETSRQNYQSLLDKRLSAGMSEDLERHQQAERFMVLDLARTPEKPYQPKRLPLMAAAVMLGLILPSAITLAIGLKNGTMRAEAQLAAMLPAKMKSITTVPPILSKSDIRSLRVRTMQVALLSVFACAALILFLAKVRPAL